MIKLNLGSGNNYLIGYINIDCSDKFKGQGLMEDFNELQSVREPDLIADARDLRMFADESVDEIYSSHMLEHLPAYETFPTLCEWCRLLKPGGAMKIAVPDFDYLFERLREKERYRDFWDRCAHDPGVRDAIVDGKKHSHTFDLPEEVFFAILFSGGHHKTAFNEIVLAHLLGKLPLINIRRFKSEYINCGNIEYTLRLMGEKPVKKESNTSSSAKPQTEKATQERNRK